VPTLSLLAAAVIFSTGGIAIKLSGLSAWQLVFGRSAIAVGTLLVLLPEARRGWTTAAMVAAVPYAATMTLFVLSTRLTTAANAIVLQSTAPLYLLLLGPWLLDEPVRRRDLAFLVVMLVGVALVTLDTEAIAPTAPNRVLGNVIALASGLAWALTILTLRRLARAQPGPPAATLVFGNLLTCLVAAPMTLPFGPVPVRDGLALVYLGTVQIPVAYLLFARGVRGVPALTTSLLMLLEPVLNPLWVWLFHGERPGPTALVGGGLVLVATAVRAVQTTSSR
jgi:drug/metabolite transporter (DMT)-like permease